MNGKIIQKQKQAAQSGGYYNLGVRCGNPGHKWLDLDFTLWMELTGFANGFYVF